MVMYIDHLIFLFFFFLPKFVQSTTSPKSPLLWPNKISNVSTDILCVEIQKPKLLMNIWVYNYTHMYAWVPFIGTHLV